MFSKSNLIFPLLKVAEFEPKTVGSLEQQLIRLRLALCPTSGFSSSFIPASLALKLAELRLSLHFSEPVHLCSTDEVTRNFLTIISICRPLSI
jgi:hypothetical protein